jgi:hypothetical protein
MSNPALTQLHINKQKYKNFFGSTSPTAESNSRLGTRYSDQDIKRGHNEIAKKYGKDPETMRMSIPMIEKHLDAQSGNKPLTAVPVQPAPVKPAPVKKSGLFSRLLGNAAKFASTTAANVASDAATSAATNAITSNMNLTPEENSKIMECKRILASKVTKGGKRKTQRKNKKSKRPNKRHNKITRKKSNRKHTRKN